MSPTPQVLFVCVHNAGRSQMAAAFLDHHADGAVEVRSAGSAPADTINPAVREAMAEVGIDISAEQPKLLTTDAVEASDVVITMGCGDACPIFPGKRYLDWQLPDPAGKGVDAVRPIRDEIDRAGPRPRRRAHRRRIPRQRHDDPVGAVRLRPQRRKSQMAAGLMRKAAGGRVIAHSAGTDPGAQINALSAEALAEVGVDITGETPRPIDPDLLRTVDVVVTLGREAHGRRPRRRRLQNWDTDEPSERGIDGIERMRLVRDDINSRVLALAEELTSRHR